MQLQEKLDQFKRTFYSNPQVTKEVIEIMDRNTNQLRSSGILNRVLQVGRKMPSFSLSNQEGQLVSSDSLLAKGPIVATFFRGVW